MPKLAIVGTIEATPGRREQLVALLMAHAARSLLEPGTLQFEVLVPNDDSTKVLLYEVYQDTAAYEDHRNAPSLARFKEECVGIMAKASQTVSAGDKIPH